MILPRSDSGSAAHLASLKQHIKRNCMAFSCDVRFQDSLRNLGFRVVRDSALVDGLRLPTATRLPFHQIGHFVAPRYLWPREQVFHPPLFALAMFDSQPRSVPGPILKRPHLDGKRCRPSDFAGPIESCVQVGCGNDTGAARKILGFGESAVDYLETIFAFAELITRETALR
jgi:hypothetical protein